MLQKLFIILFISLMTVFSSLTAEQAYMPDGSDMADKVGVHV